MIAQATTSGDYSFLVFVVAWLISAFVAAAIWKNRGGSAGEGFFLGLVLGILGIILAAVMTPRAVKEKQAQQVAMMRECPFCKQQIRRDASVCPFCQRESEAWTFHSGAWWVKRNGQWLYLNEQNGSWDQLPASDKATVSESGF
jgi:hypothetical protein